jgi:hypothetical protein
LWTNPRYRELTGREPPGRSQATAEPPRPSGETLATFPRKSREGPETELRLVLDEFQGSPYLALRVWQQDQAGNWWPVKGKGVSVRLAEAEGVADALREALGRADRPEPPTREAPPKRRQRPEGRRQWDDMGSPPAPSKGYDDAY